MALLDDLLRLYRDVPLSPYQQNGGESGSGFCLVREGQRVGGVSIGTEEVEILARIAQLSGARFAYTVGVAFGFSTACLALANPAMTVFGIDNYAEDIGDRSGYVEGIARRILGSLPNVHLCIGTSPQDTPRCLSALPPDTPLSLVFIDGEHTELAATADFMGCRPYINDETIVVWHDIDKIPKTFESLSMPFHRTLRLSTWRHLGVYLNPRHHGAVEEYLSRFAS
jgi:predicted O-methyltransferase YrrM